MNIKLITRHCLIAVLVLSTAAIANAQVCPPTEPLLPGSLDPTFGANCSGKAVYQIHNSLGVQPDGMAVQADGNIVAVVGYDVEQLVRLNADGSLDQSFGTGGIVRFSWTTVPGAYGNVLAVAFQDFPNPNPNINLPEQRIVIAGVAPIQSGRSTINALRVARYLPNGDIDTSFGSGGSSTFNVGGGYASAIAIQPDGKILTVGVDVGKLVRLTANGALDTTFGSGGVVSTYSSRALALDAAGGILVGGATTVGKGKTARSILAVKRYSANGSADASFGTSGVATADFGVSAQTWNLKIDALGSILVSGTASGGALARFTSNGIADGSLGGGTGKVVYTGLPGIGRGLVVQPNDGKIIITGQTNNNFGLVRFNYDGSLDTGFGTNGKVEVDVSGPDYSNVSVFQTDPGCSCPKIVMSGGSVPNTSFARFILQ